MFRPNTKQEITESNHFPPRCSGLIHCRDLREIRIIFLSLDNRVIVAEKIWRNVAKVSQFNPAGNGRGNVDTKANRGEIL